MTEQRFDAVVFDAYGTLLDVHAAMARHAKRLGSNWQALAAEWRIKQLEYSWIDNMTVHRARRDLLPVRRMPSTMSWPATPSTAEYAPNC
jgi:HAD superfamily hydrolase (TIGR01493 family)